MYEPQTGKEITVQAMTDSLEREEDVGYSPVEEENAGRDDSKTWGEARSAVESNDLGKAERLFEKFLDQTKIPQSEEPDHERRNSARDILDALEALKHGSKVESVRAYIAARNAA